MLEGYTFGLKHEKSRLLVLLFTITACVVLAFYVGFIMGEEIVYTHFFYIPIILAGAWYYRKAVYAALFLSIVHILVTHLSVQVVTIDNFERCAVFIGVAYVIGLISEKRAKGKEALAASKAYAESIIRNFLDTLIVVNTEANIQTVNPATYHLLGYTEEELIGKSVSIIFAEEEEEEVRRVFQFFREPEKAEVPHPQDTVRNRELTYKTKDGRLIPMSLNASVLTDETGNVTGVVAGAKDITKLKLAEAEIRKEKIFSENIIATVPDSLLVLDKNLRIKSANRTFYETFQTEPEKVIGSSIAETLQDKDGKLSTDLTKLFGTEDMLENFELDYQSKKLGERIFNIRVRGIIFAEEEEEEEEEELVVIEDITERRRMEETLIQSEKLKALGEMAGGVAHDFNNLLAIILGNAQLLERGMEKYKAEEIKERVKIIAQTAYEGGETVRRLQYFTSNKLLAHDFTKLDLNEIVREAIASTSPRWKDEAEAKGATIRIKEELGKLPSILGSRSELMEVLTNLIFNALEAMPEGGEITIKTEAKENKVYLYFTDSGKGIPNRIKKKIFDPFFTTKGLQSSGLGLSVSYGIIKHHRGKIKVESSKKKGTTFTISIPVSPKVTLEKEKLRAPKKISLKKILVVDDEEGIREVLKTILQDEGHRVVLAETVQEGLDKFKQDNSALTLTGLEDKFDLVLTDMGMPEMSGWQLAKKIKRMNPDVLVGLITGWTSTITKEKIKEEGVDFVLSKPFDYIKVLREVNAVLKSKKR